MGLRRTKWGLEVLWVKLEVDIYACALPMPTPERPDKDEWVKTITNAVGTSSDEIFWWGTLSVCQQFCAI
jgi:hypothetical protein